MKIRICNELSLNVINPYKSGTTKTIIFLHGFTGNSGDWDNFFEHMPKDYCPFSYDLIGHGLSDSPTNIEYYKEESQLLQLKEVIDFFNLKNITLLGYSMGGRLALSFALKYPELVNSLILESTTAGIQGNAEAGERRQKDKELADFILTNNISKFVTEWMNKDLFRGLRNLPEEIFDRIYQSKLKNSKVGLANSLLGFGTGSMQNLWENLEQIKCPVLLMTGKNDEKFTLLAKKMAAKIENSQHLIFNNCYHNLHVEKELAFINYVQGFLS